MAAVVTFNPLALRRSVMIGANSAGNDTTAKILETDKILLHAGSTYYSGAKTNGGVSIIYRMETPTNILNPAGIIPTSAGQEVIARSGACLFVFDENQTPFSYVNENTQSGGYNRWAQNEGGTMTEFSNSWTLAANYYYIQFSVDIRYLDRAYMYDKESGQIWFAGKNTPYYGMTNISQA